MKRIQVWQMYETDEQKKMKMEREKEEQEMKEKEVAELMTREKEELRNNMTSIQQEYNALKSAFYRSCISRSEKSNSESEYFPTHESDDHNSDNVKEVTRPTFPAGLARCRHSENSRYNIRE